MNGQRALARRTKSLCDLISTQMVGEDGRVCYAALLALLADTARQLGFADDDVRRHVDSYLALDRCER